MGTRGAIARAQGDGWSGRYHHWDSYPTGLGRSLWNHLHGHFGGDVEKMTAFFIDQHPAGWSTVVEADLNIEPGFIEYPRRHSDHPGQAECYCHGDRSEEAQDLTSENGDPCFIEWVYVISPTHLTVLAGVAAATDDPTARRGEYGTVPYRHALVGVYPLDGEAPNWEEVEQRGERLRHEAWKTHAAPLYR
ncbi:hypothetical protein [Nitrolancea hollandica]|uniref:Uncharacterized protein n=1 Tax=Nitrolancea hollandica Lb TaxID=1129897 RepID=I4EL26_9BACT|nr:hypothetical protein [Nitrolancea hollandica]CCF85388.1 hypothetical protein NITHO_4910003 [Nitrolancea hollandica Lb]